MKKKIKNVINWENEADYRFIYEKKQIALTEKTYLFSLVIAMYNSAAFIKETIQSILAQDLDFTENIQLILVDDGSTDETLSICKTYAKQYPENIVLVHKENGGVSSARNVGMRFVTGQYINFIDSDDKFSPNVCRCVKNFFDKYAGKVDVVTIKNELFGAKTGDSWFNNKFKNGTRLINLWKEPQIYLNSTNCTFFHKRVRNQLYFDETLRIAEDLKVVNFVLMNKWALGVISDCIYYYRIRSGEEGSLAGMAREKEYWYTPYLQKVFYELYDIAMKRCGFCPEYLQYTLFRDLWNRFNDNKECERVLKTKETLEEYKALLFSALSCIDDKVILHNSFLNSDEQVYLLAIKHGVPSLERKDSSVSIFWPQIEKAVISKKLYACFEKASASGNVLTLEGYVVINNVRIPLKEYQVSCSCGDNDVVLTEIPNTDNDRLAFADEKILFRRYFTIKVTVQNKRFSPIDLFLNINGITFPVAIYGYGKWFCVSTKYPGEYYQEDRVLLTLEKGVPVVRKGGSLSALSAECRFLRSLNKAGESGKKIVRYRLAYHLWHLFPHRKMWIISDRKIAAGDNGQAFYEYVRRKKSINSYFAIIKDTEDYPKLKRLHFRLLDLNSRKYKLRYLLADDLISAHFDGLELEPISKDGIHDIIAKKRFVFLQHGIIKDDLSKFYSRKIQNLDMFVTSAIGEYNSLIENNNYFCDASVTKLTGLPRYDKLHTGTRRTILVMPTWRNGICVGNKINPERFTSTSYYKFYHALLSDERLQGIAAERGYRICYFSHFNIIESNRFMSDIPNVYIPSPEERDYQTAFAEAALMVTDYSSTAFDLAYLRKPIVYCQGDKEEFFAHHTYTKGYYDYERDGFGPVTYDVESAVDAIIDLIERDCKISDKYLERINNFFPYQDKKNCERVYKAILNLDKGEK